MDMYMFPYSYAYDKEICKEPQLCICIKAKSKKALEYPRDRVFFLQMTVVSQKLLMWFCLAEKG